MARRAAWRHYSRLSRTARASFQPGAHLYGPSDGGGGRARGAGGESAATTSWPMSAPWGSGWTSGCASVSATFTMSATSAAADVPRRRAGRRPRPHGFSTRNGSSTPASGEAMGADDGPPLGGTIDGSVATMCAGAAFIVADGDNRRVGSRWEKRGSRARRMKGVLYDTVRSDGLSARKARPIVNYRQPTPLGEPCKWE